MIRKTLLLLILCYSFWQSQAQIVISHDIDFQDSTQFHQLQTLRGDRFVGQIKGIANDSLFFQILGTTNPTTFLFADVHLVWVRNSKRPKRYGNDADEIAINPKTGEPLDHPTSYLLYSTTAFPSENSRTYRNVVVLWNQIDFQVNQYFSAGFGAFIPAFLSGRVQGKISINDLIHAGLAVEHYEFVFVDDGRATHPYAMVTVGERDKYLNFSFGYWIRGGTFFVEDPFPMVSLGGSVNFTKNWRFYAEAMAIFDQESTDVIPTFMFGHYKKRRVIELGVAALPQTDFPLFPVLAYKTMF